MSPRIALSRLIQDRPFFRGIIRQNCIGDNSCMLQRPRFNHTYPAPPSHSPCQERSRGRIHNQTGWTFFLKKCQFRHPSHSGPTLMISVQHEIDDGPGSHNGGRFLNIQISSWKTTWYRALAHKDVQDCSSLRRRVPSCSMKAFVLGTMAKHEHHRYCSLVGKANLSVTQ